MFTWVVLYVKRWLSAPLALPDGTLQQRDRGTPPRVRGLAGAGEPVHAFAFDMWMAREYPGVASSVMRWTRSCTASPSAKPGTWVAAIGDRMEQDRAAVASRQDESVYCKTGNADSIVSSPAFTFLGSQLSVPSRADDTRKMFVSFQPAINKDAQNKISGQIRRMAAAPQDLGTPSPIIARQINPVVRGMDAVLRSFLPLRAEAATIAHQRYLMRWSATNTNGCAPPRRPRQAGNASPASIPGSSPTGHGCAVPGGQDDKSR